MGRLRVVAALIADPSDPGRFLAQQRLPGASRANLWEFPGGKVELGESEPEALTRECREELAVDVEVGQRLWATTHGYADVEVELVLYAARIVRGVPVAHGAQALRFCTPREMTSLPFCEADLPLIAGLADGSIATR